MEKVKFRSLYADVFKKHTTVEAESRFIVGTPRTTPDITKTPLATPRPWLFAKVLVLSLVSFAAFYCGAFLFKNAIFLPGLILFGSIITPVSLLIFFWEINILQNISLYKLTLMMVKGSIMSLLCTVTLYAVIDGQNSPLLIGVVEETAKILTFVLLIDHRPYKFVLNGMLVGAAVGTGFAAFESAGYILITALQYGVPTMLNTIFWRALFTPGGHIAWAALTGAALILVKGERTFRVKMLLDPRFLGMTALVIALHAAWDYGKIQIVVWNIPVVPVALTVISWVILFAMMRLGFKQVARVQAENIAPVQPEEL